MSYCGIDFGTSNSSVGVIEDGQATLVQFSNQSPTTPSAIFYCIESGEIFFGRAAVERYTSGINGRLLRSLKSVLGSSLIDEKTRVGKRHLAFRDIIADYLRYLKIARDATATADAINGPGYKPGSNVESVVLGRPVQYVDDDEVKDQAAQRVMHEIALELGFQHVEFQYEPIAAALSYESTADKQGIALIVDIGGGTADFSIIKVVPKRHTVQERKEDILATMGVHIGGTDIDRLLSLCTAMPTMGLGSLTRETQREQPSSIYFDLATWHKIQTLYKKETMLLLDSMRLDAAEPEKLQRLADIISGRHGHALAAAVEAVKIRLSSVEQTTLNLTMLNPEIDVQVTRQEMEQAIRRLMDQLQQCLLQGVRDAQISTADIDTLFFTGGSSSINLIRKTIQDLVPQADVVQGDEFGSVGLGLAIDAQRKFA